MATYFVGRSLLAPCGIDTQLLQSVTTSQKAFLHSRVRREK